MRRVRALTILFPSIRRSFQHTSCIRRQSIRGIAFDSIPNGAINGRSGRCVPSRREETREISPSPLLSHGRPSISRGVEKRSGYNEKYVVSFGETNVSYRRVLFVARPPFSLTGLPPPAALSALDDSIAASDHASFVTRPIALDVRPATPQPGDTRADVRIKSRLVYAQRKKRATTVW